MYRSLETQLDLEKQCVAAQNLGKYFHQKANSEGLAKTNPEYAKLIQECSASEYRDARYIMGLDE